MRFEIEAPFVNPKTPYETVFLFNISKGLAQHKNVYEATRQSWRFSKVIDLGGGLAIGLQKGISLGVYYIERWNGVPQSTSKVQRHLFESDRRYDGQSGIDGNGAFRIIHGSANKAWRKL
jgi:hypothetical protein